MQTSIANLGGHVAAPATARRPACHARVEAMGLRSRAAGQRRTRCVFLGELEQPGASSLATLVLSTLLLREAH